MRTFDENSITPAALARHADCSNPRLKLVMDSLVRHLHGFVREVEPTFEEWLAGIEFLTATGHMCDDQRQEFILLSDTLGVSMLVDAINHRQPAGATETTLLGPFFVEGAPEVANGADITGAAKGEPLYVEGTVRSVDGRPLSGATVDVWSADAEGFYDVQREDSQVAARGRLRTGADGSFHFKTVLPVSYPVPHDGPVGQLLRTAGRHPWRPAHLHFLIAAPGHETLVTHVFVEGDPYLDSDAVFGVKDSLVQPFVKRAQGATPDGRQIAGEHYYFRYDFGLKPAALQRAAE